ncbi:MAG TPA: proton-conducting transporter membrane subunit, partial [Nitrospiria bacterium]
LFKVQPLTAAALLTASLALVGMPPLSMFVSEFSVLASLATRVYASDTIHIGRFMTVMVADEVRNLGLIICFLGMAVVVFGGFLYRVVSMVWGDPPERLGRGERWGLGQISLIINIGALAILGIMMPDFLKRLLGVAVATIGTR